MHRGTALALLLALPLGAALLRDAVGWPTDLAPAGSIRGASAATLRLPHRWPAAVPWYLAGGAPAPLVAWQPIGAASQAASYTPVVGAIAASAVGSPSWSAAGGWYLPTPTTDTVRLGAADDALARGFAAAAAGTLCIRYRLLSAPSNDLRVLVGSSIAPGAPGWALGVDDRAPRADALLLTVSDGTAGNYIALSWSGDGVVGTTDHVVCVQMAGVGVGAAWWVDGESVPADDAEIADRTGVETAPPVLAARNPSATPFAAPSYLRALAWWPGSAQPTAAQIVAISAAMGAL